MKKSEVALLTLRAGGARGLVNTALSYLENRILIAVNRGLPFNLYRRFRIWSARRILEKQSGEAASVSLFESLVPEMVGMANQNSLQVVIPDHMRVSFDLAGRIISRPPNRYSVFADGVEDPDVLVIVKPMLNQVPVRLADTIQEMCKVFDSDTYLVAFKPDLVPIGNCKRDDLEDYATSIRRNRNEGEIEAIEKYGRRFYVRSGTMDAGIVDEVEIDYMRPLVGIGFRGKNVIDLGSHIGSFAVQVNRLLSEDGKTICVEPSPSNYELVKMNISENDLAGKVVPRDCAVSAKKGKGQLFISSNNTGGNKLDMVEASSTSSIEVDVVTLEDLMGEFDGEIIDLIKIDVEGSELAILSSSIDAIRERVRVVVGEAGGTVQGDGQSTVDLLKANGFSVTYTGDAQQLVFCALNTALN